MKRILFFLSIILVPFLVYKGVQKTLIAIEYNKNTSRSEKIILNKDLLKDVTILTSSYDGYSELWRPHYELLFKYWPSLKEDLSYIPIKLITNELKYEDPRVESINVVDQNWSKNLIQALKHVNTKYTLLLLDDYIINSPVNENRFIELLSLLEQRNAAYIEIVIDEGHFWKGNESEKKPVLGIDDVIYRSKNSKRRNSLQAAIWNTEELLNLIDPNESPWDFERDGSKRTLKNPKPFYLVVKDPVMTYLNAVAKRIYEKHVIDYINSENIEFQPTSLPVLDAEEMAEYLKTKKAKKIMKNFHGTSNK